MQEQKFEEEVRQKMEELSLVPSEPVWKKVEEQIRKKRDRRFIYLWLLPLVLLSIGIIWWSMPLNETSSNLASEKARSNNQDFNQNVTSDKKDTNTNIKQMNVETRVLKGEQRSINKIAPRSSYPTVKNIKIKNYKNRVNSYTHQSIKNQKIEKLFHADKFILSDKKFQDDIDTTIDVTVINPLDQQSNLEKIKIGNSNQETKETEQNVETAKVPQQTDIQIPFTKKIKKLQFGAIAQVGFSGITSGILDGFGQKSFQVFADASSPQFGTGGSTTLPPSTINRGISYALGISIQKDINLRSNISSGLQNQYYSTRIIVGSMRERDTVLMNFSSRVNSYYRNDNELKEYTNKFYFITLHVVYNYQISKRVPISLGAGLSISQLVSSNALHYNRGANIYYQDNELLHKTQTGLISSLTFELLRKKKLTLNLGPELNYFLTPLLKKNSSQRQHLYSIGLKGQLKF